MPGFVKGRFVKGGFVKRRFVKGRFVKHGFLKGRFVKHGFLKQFKIKARDENSTDVFFSRRSNRKPCNKS